jgi:hypothetical protein
LKSQPFITNLLGDELLQKARIPKPTARNTPLRYSSAHSCARQQSYAAFGAEVTEPVDFSGAWVMGVGTIIHEQLQEAIGRKYPTAEFEASSQIDQISGSCDALIDSKSLFDEHDDDYCVFELKTMGTYSFDQQVGWNRMRGTVGAAKGPALKAITQAGMNALGLERERGIRVNWVIMGSITFEALSKQKSEKLQISDTDRVMAEFWLDRHEWEGWAWAEINRMEAIADRIENGLLADRQAIDDTGTLIELDPKGSAWNCAYCQYRTLCTQDGPGTVWINDSSLRVRKGSDDGQGN